MRKKTVMERGDHGDIGSCDFLDALEGAVVAHRRVYVELKAGGHFVDRPIDVVTENGADYGVFAARGRVAVGDMHAVSDAGPETDAPATAR